MEVREGWLGHPEVRERSGVLPGGPGGVEIQFQRYGRGREALP